MTKFLLSWSWIQTSTTRSSVRTSTTINWFERPLQWRKKSLGQWHRSPFHNCNISKAATRAFRARRTRATSIRCSSRCLPFLMLCWMRSREMRAQIRWTCWPSALQSFIRCVAVSLSRRITWSSCGASWPRRQEMRASRRRAETYRKRSRHFLGNFWNGSRLCLSGECQPQGIGWMN